MSFLKAFQYKRRNSLIHRLDPRSKFLLSLVLMTFSIVFIDIRVLIAILTLQLFLIGLARALKEWVYSLRGLIFFIIIIFITQLLFGGTLFMGIVLSIRLIVLSSSMSWFFLS
ncbi:MAG: hypothetical protein QXM51_02105, partial [Thermoproteota archaeon]